MVNKHDLSADGISVVLPKAFQSYATSIYKSSKGNNVFTIPKEISHHLNLQKHDIIEIAIRKIPRKYAYKAYGYWHIRAKCSKCGRLATLCFNGRAFLFIHNNEGHLTSHYCSKNDFDKIFNDYLNEEVEL